MKASNETRVTSEVKDGVCTITINRPEAKNALSKSMYAAIRDACLDGERRDDVDVIVMRGSNGAFSVGGDLTEILSILESDNPTAIFDYEEYLPFEAVRTVNKPTIAVIDGLCLGGGLTLALMCDISIATDRSRFAIPEAKVGIVDGHLPRLLRQSVPAARLRYWMYTGVLFPASEAHEVGMMSKIVPPDQLEAVVAKTVKEVRASSLSAIQACKKILNETRPLSPMTDAFLTLVKPEVLKRLQAFKK
jgi:enoyl-CoA hydratase/carnithine racemase